MRNFIFTILLVLGPCSAWAQLAVALNSGDQSISILDTRNYREIERITVGKEPHHLMATPDDQLLIVANAVGNELVFLDPNTGKIKNRLANISDPYQIGFSPDKKWFVSASLRLHRVDIYRASDYSLVKRIETPKAPSHLIFDQNSTHVFVTLQDTNQVAAIDLTTQAVKWTVPVGKVPSGIWMTPDDKYLLVGILGEDFVEVIDWRKQTTVKRLKTRPGAHNFLAVGDGRHVLVTNRASDSISIIDQQTLEVKETFAVPGGPDCMDLTRDGKELWVTTRWIKKVTVIDMQTKQIKRTIPVGKSPHGIYLHEHAARR